MGVTPYKPKRVTPMLSDVSIRKAKPGPKSQKIADTRGLFLLVTSAGRRWWRFKYRFAGKEKLLSLGVYPDVSLKEAREKCDAARKLVAAGSDSAFAAKKRPRAKLLRMISGVARDWLENMKENGRGTMLTR